MKKKLVAMMLACTLVFSMSGCGQKTADNTAAQEETAEEEPAAEETDSEEAAEENDAEEAAYTEEKISVPSTNGDYEISAILTMPATDEKVPLVAMLHGFGGSKDENGSMYICRTLAKRGIASIRMDFAGTGEDTREFADYSLDSAAADATDCVDYAVANANVDADRLGLFGYSNGGRIAVIMSGEADQRYKVRVLLAPAIFSDHEELSQFTGPEADKKLLEECQETGTRDMEWYGNTITVGKGYYESTVAFAENLATYEQVKVPTLVINGTNDVMAPKETVESFIEATEAHQLIIPGADHGYGFYSNDDAGYTYMDTVTGMTTAFFNQYFTDDNAKAMFGEQQ